MTRYLPVDRDGNRLNAGDRVRVVGIPDLSGMAADGLSEVLPVFEHIVGSYKRIRGFDQLGCAELVFTIRHAEGNRTWHTVWIEPFLLHLPRSTSKPKETPETRR